MRSFYFVFSSKIALNVKFLLFSLVMVLSCATAVAAHSAPITSVTTCNSSLGGFSIINLNNNSSSALSNGAVLTLSSLPSSWNIEVAASGNTDGSVKFTLSGSASNTVIENAVPFRYAGDAVPANLGVGSYTLKAEIFTADNAGGTKCDTKIISFTIQSGCNLTVNAGADKTLCTSPLTITSTITGAKTCTVPGVEDCTHSIHSYGGYVNGSASAGVCGDNAGAKLWTKNDGTTAWIIVDLGSQLPAGTQICTRMKLEHCGNTSSNYSSAKIQASANSGSGYSNLVSAVTFSHTSYQDYCYTLSSAARYIKISDNGHCSIRVDYVKSTTPSSSNSNVTYSWSGTGIVGAANQANITVNQAGTYTVTATNCDGSCTATDQMVVSPCPPVCTLSVNAGNDKELCSSTTTLTASSTGAKTCTTPGVEDCAHTVNGSGGWLENVNASAICNDNAGTKLWTKSGQGTSWITIDLGSQLPAGTQICVRMKLEHCSNTSTNYSNAKIQASANSGSGFADLASSVTFTQTSFQNYCYNLSSAARYIKISDNGNCAFRVDYVKYTTTGSSTNVVNYSWSGPGIVGASNLASINVNQIGTYTVTATNCDGSCNATDQVVVNDCPPSCTLQVDAGDDQLICGPLQLVINSTVTGASTCNTTGTSDCNHTVSASGGWLENVNASAICGDNTGTKLWTKSGQGTSWITVDFGTTVPAGTSICVRMKLEHCSNTSTNYSNAKIEASANSGSGFTSLTNSVTFTQTSFQEFCYTLTSPARYVKVSDNGNCAFRVDYVKYTTTGSSSSNVTYSWTGPGIVGTNNQPSVTVNQSGTYTVTVTDCNGCIDTDEVQIINDTNPPVLTGVPANLNVECADEVPVPATVTAWDNINGNVQVVFSEVVTSGCPYAIIRTWTATDNCGNEASATQTINVHDTTDPELHGVPSNLNLSCDQNVPDCDVWASDNCDQELIVTLHAETINQECGYLFVRTWSVTDACGNTTSASQTITFFDNTNPTVVQGVPASLTIECDEVIPEYLPTFEDNCDEELEVEATSSISNQTSCGHNIERSWTATDACGNSFTVYQVIHVVDTTNPELVGVPSNETVECDAIPAPANVTATDNCSEAGVQLVELASPGCPYTITRTWTATDECGNQSIATQVITVIDTTNPTLIGVPANTTVECSDIPAASVVTADDNCSEELEVVYVQTIVPGNACTYTIVRTWTVEDACGNETSASQVLTVTDTTNPTLDNVPSSITVECDAIPAAAQVTGSDNCDENVEVTMVESSTDGCPYTITRTWTGVDNCGNEVSGAQVITVIDTTFPELHGVPANITLECDQPVPAVEVYATDNCTDELEVSLNASTQTNECGSVFTRTWTVVDACGNETTASQVITFVDTTNPYIVEGVPAELTIECDEDVPSFTPVFGDNCDIDLQVNYISGIAGVNSCGHNIERSWTATDACGNSFTVYQVIHVVDTTNPVLVGVPSNETVECDAIPAPANVIATDNCSEAGVQLVELASPGCPYTITRTWTATDECGNQSIATQVITVIDTTNPVASNVPAPHVTVECGQEVALVVPVFTDNCDNDLEIEFTEYSVSGSCVPGLIRTWVATDNCDNSTVISQVITFIDTTAPVLVGVPESITVECDAVPAVSSVVAEDICDDEVIVEFSETVTGGCPYTITRTWYAIDQCENEVTATQVITVIDTTFPVLHGVPSNITLECNQPVPAVDVYATDNCTDELEVSLSANTVTYGCGSTFTRTWTVADACGNETTASQVITFVDTTNPYIVEGVPAELTIECDEDVPSFTPVFGDNCDTDLQVNYISGIAGVNSCGHDIERSWTATDACGNSFTVYQVIHVVDTTNPELVGVPADETVECDAIPAPANVTATDNCSEAGVQLVELASPGCPYTITRTWTATDECGNQSIATQVITVIDTTNPTLIGVPANTTVECSDIPAASVVTADDNCSEELEVVYVQTIVTGNACTYTIVRTWTVEDACGNETSASQVLTVTDTTNPTLDNVPTNITVECDAIPAAAQVTGSDNCDENVEVTMVESSTDGCPYTITRTWTGVDNCGNDVSGAQVITIIDTTFPELHGIPANITLECDQPVPAVEVYATDNCTDELEVSLSANTVTYNCGSTFTRTWTVEDACGNETTASQVITFVDTTNPYFNNAPENATVDCDDIPSVPFVTAGDNCDDDVVVSFSQQMTEGCPYTITRTWTATDDCNNQTVHVQILTVIDTVDPVIVAPADITVECSDIPAPVQLSATDNCDNDVEVEFSESIVEGTSCVYTIVRTWIATDNCENQTTAQQVLTVVDTTYPVLVGIPADVTVECNNVPAPVTVGATDNCSTNLVVTSTDAIDYLTCGYIITRTYSVSDDCGLTTSQDQVITVVDTTDPTINEWPSDITIACGDEIPAAGEIVATDNCDNELEVLFNEAIVQLECGYQIVRTWTATDDCGNNASVDQVINVVDETNPVVIGVPADITIECNETVPAPVNPTITDNCDNDIVIQVSDVEVPQVCGYQIIRTYRATDDCGNSTVISQIITVVDTTNPEITAPDDITVSCENVPAPAVLTATDNCDLDVNVIYMEEIEAGCPYTIVRTWTATDDCGNQTIVTQLVHVYDEVNPVFDAFPAYVEVECDQASEYTLTATDNCDSDVEVTVISELQVSGQCYGSLLRTYQAMDNCGNTVTAFQIVDLVDSTAPVLHNIPADESITCGQALPVVSNAVFATDNCTNELNVVYSEVQTNEFCPYDVIRTWSVVDDCGNVTSATQTIHVSVEVAGTINMQVYPNPAREHFQLKLSVPNDEAHVTGEVLDVAGKVVYTFMNGKADGGRLYNWDVNARDLNAGMYTVSLKVGDKVINEKLMILGN